MKRLVGAVAVASGLVGGAALAEQSPLDDISYAALAHAPVGAWADYLMSKEGEPEVVTVRYALLSRDTKQAALEIDSKTPIGRVITHIDFVVDGAKWTLKKARVRIGDMSPTDAPLPNEGGRSAGKEQQLGKVVGKETIQVKAGKIAAVHYKPPAKGELWSAETTFPVGIVKIVEEDGSTIELVGTGSGAKASF